MMRGRNTHGYIQYNLLLANFKSLSFNEEASKVFSELVVYVALWIRVPIILVPISTQLLYTVYTQYPVYKVCQPCVSTCFNSFVIPYRKPCTYTMTSFSSSPSVKNGMTVGNGVFHEGIKLTVEFRNIPQTKNLTMRPLM